MNKINGLSSDPMEAYQQGRRDGAAEALQAAELAVAELAELKPLCVKESLSHCCSHCDQYAHCGHTK